MSLPLVAQKAQCGLGGDVRLHEGRDTAPKQQFVSCAIDGGLSEIEVADGGLCLLLIDDGRLTLRDSALEAILLGTDLRPIVFDVK